MLPLPKPVTLIPWNVKEICCKEVNPMFSVERAFIIVQVHTPFEQFNGSINKSIQTNV